MLQLPAAWTGFIDTNVGGTSCLGPLAGLQAQRELYEKTVRALSDPVRTTVFLVSRPEHSALAEAARTHGELRALGLTNQRLVLNGIFHARAKNDPTAIALEERGREALANMPMTLQQLPRIEVPLVARALIGVGALRHLGTGLEESGNGGPVAAPEYSLPASLAALLPDLSARGKGVIMTMGKGGVGKTTVAAALALELASRGHRVHLTTTDPAAHLHLALLDEIPGLQVSRIDPVAETLAYTAEVMGDAGRDLDEKGRALLEEDLRSPCTEEIAVFRAFARCVDEGNQGFVVIDTAPTGHTLLLLDAAEAYHRDVARNLTYIPDSVRRLLPQLRDPNFTSILIVALAEPTPVHEAARLQEDLERAGITPYAWVINQTFCATGTRDPVLSQRATLELHSITEVRDKFASRVALIPWQSESPVGAHGLHHLLETAVAQ